MAPLPGCRRWGNVFLSPLTFNYRRDTLNGWGFHDMSGNVSEWVEDCWHPNYAGAPRDGSAWTTGGDCAIRMYRGGSWAIFPSWLHSSDRDFTRADLRGSSTGFRVLRTFE